MAGNYKLTYNVDLVFCIDATGSMDGLIETVKKNTMNLYDDVVRKMKEKHKTIKQLRVKIIAFRDYLEDGEDAMLNSDFFVLPDEREDLRECLEDIEAFGGGDIPEDGLEALAYAIRSSWVETGEKRRHVIIVWTDAPTHPIRFGEKASNYPSAMPANFAELSRWWGNYGEEGYMDARAKRLGIFAPETEEDGTTPSIWTMIAKSWDQAMMIPVEPDNGLNEVDYEMIVDMIRNTI